MNEVEDMIDTMAGELFRQGRAISDAPDAPLVADGNGPDFLLVEGKVDLRRLAMAIQLMTSRRSL